MGSLLFGRGESKMKMLGVAAMALMMAGQAWATPAEELIAGVRKECRGCDLSEVSFKKANLEGVDLTGAILTNASFHRANLRGAILDGVSANGANFNMIDGTQASFKGADLTRTMMYGAQLSGADLDGANLTEARLQTARLTSAHLIGAVLDRMVARDVVANNADFSGTSMQADQPERRASGAQRV